MAKNARLARALNKTQLAAAIGVDRSYYTNIENGVRGSGGLSAHLLARIATVLNIPLDEALRLESQYVDDQINTA